MVALFSEFWKIFILSSMMFVLAAIPNSTFFPMQGCQHWFFSSLNGSHFNCSEVKAHCGFLFAFHWWLVILSIFIYVCFVILYLNLWTLPAHNLCPFLNWIIWLFCPVSWALYGSCVLILYPFSNIVSLSVGCLFTFLTDCLMRSRFLHWCALMCFCFNCLYFCNLFQNSLPITMLCRVFPMFSSSNAMTSGHRFRPLIHLELVFV